MIHQRVASPCYHGVLEKISIPETEWVGNGHDQNKSKSQNVTEDGHVHPSFSKYFMVSSYVIAVSEGLSESSSESACAYSCNQEKNALEMAYNRIYHNDSNTFFNLHRGLSCN